MPKNSVGAIGSIAVIAFLLAFGYIESFANWLMTPMLGANEVLHPAFFMGFRIAFWGAVLAIGLIRDDWTDAYTKFERMNWIAGVFTLISILTVSSNIGSSLKEAWNAFVTKTDGQTLAYLGFAAFGLAIVIGFAIVKWIKRPRKPASRKSS